MKVASINDEKLIETELKAMQLVQLEGFIKIYELFLMMKTKKIPFRVGCLLLQGFESKKINNIGQENEILLKTYISFLKQNHYETVQQFISFLTRNKLKGYDNIADILLRMK
jgi:hypothetical protein